MLKTVKNDTPLPEVCAFGRVSSLTTRSYGLH